MGLTLCDEQDIKDRLELGPGDNLTTEQQQKWPAKAAEATAQVEGYLHREWTTTIGDVPTAVRIVTSRMTVRAMTAPVGAGAPVDGQSGASSTFGPMSYNRRFGEGAVFTSPWLSRADKQALDPYIARAAVYNEPMYDTTLHDRTGYDFCPEPGWSSP